MGAGSTKAVKQHNEDASLIVTATDTLDAKYGKQRAPVAYEDTDKAMLGLLDPAKAAQQQQRVQENAGTSAKKNVDHRAPRSGRRQSMMGRQGQQPPPPPQQVRGAKNRRRESVNVLALSWRERVHNARLHAAMTLTVVESLQGCLLKDQHSDFISSLPFVISRVFGSELPSVVKQATRLVEAAKQLQVAQKLLEDVELQREQALINSENHTAEVAAKGLGSKDTPGHTKQHDLAPLKTTPSGQAPLGSLSSQLTPPPGSLAQQKANPFKRGPETKNSHSPNATVSGAGNIEEVTEKALMSFDQTVHDTKLLETKAKLDEVKERYLEIEKDCLAWIRTYMNRANASETAKATWAKPSVASCIQWSKTHECVPFKEQVQKLFAQGNVCIVLMAAGVGMETPSQTYIPLYQTDPWNIVETFRPEYQSAGSRLQNLAMGPRHLIQIVAKVREIAGDEAVKKMLVVIVSRSSGSHEVTADLEARNHYGMTPSNVVIVEQPYLPGYVYDPTKKEFVAESSMLGCPKLPLGTGYALSLMSMPNEAYCLDDTGDTVHIADCAIDYVMQRGATWLLINTLEDLYRYGEMVIDVDMMAMTLKAREDTKCHMSMEVEKVESLSVARKQNSVCLRNMGASGPHPERYVENMEWASFGTPELNQMLTNIKSELGGSIYTCSDRYMIYLPQVLPILKECRNASMYTPVIRLDGRHLYPIFEIADLTARCRCVAFEGKAPLCKFQEPDQIGELIRIMNIQEKMPGFMSELNRLPVSRYKPVFLDKYGKKNRLRVMVCCAQTKSSYTAFKLIQPILRRGMDLVHLVYFADTIADVPWGTKLLETFIMDDSFVDVQREVVLLSGGLPNIKHDIDKYAEKIRASFIVIGSNTLGCRTENPGSLSLRILRQGLKHTTLFVNEEHQYENAWEEIIAAAMVTHNSNLMLQFLSEVLRPSNDELTLLRCSTTDRSTQLDDMRLINIYKDQVYGKGMRCRGSLQIGKMVDRIPEMVDDQKLELMVLPAPKGLGISTEILDTFLRIRCPLMLYKVGIRET